MVLRHRRSAGVGMSAVDDRAHAARVVNNATPQHTLDYWRETEEPAASLNDPQHYRQHEVNLVTAYHHSGRQPVELLCFSGDLPLTDIFLIMCIYWRIN